MEVKVLKAVPCTREAFAPYGEFISTENRKADSENPGFSFWNALGVPVLPGETSVSIVKAVPREKMREDGLERHLKTSEVLVATGDVVLVAALTDKNNPDLPDPGTAKAFFVNRGDAVIFAPGAWHHAPLAVNETCNTYVIFDRTTPDKDFFYVDLEETFGFVWEVSR